MKICHSEAMKKIKALDEQKTILLNNEGKRCAVSYKEGEDKNPTDYDYAKTRKQIEKLDSEIRKIKHALAIANVSVAVDEFDMTIGEALVYLAQLNGEYSRLSMLAAREKKTRRITTNGVVEYTECNYDPKKAENDGKALYEKICKLQVAIDRANLNNFVEI